MSRSSTSCTLALLAAAFTAGSSLAANFQLTGWSSIPESYRRAGSPATGQFSGAGNGRTPPYAEQLIPGFSGLIPAGTTNQYIALPDNGFGAQGNSADFILGVYNLTPQFKTTSDGTTNQGPVTINGFTPFSDPSGLLNTSHIANGPVYNRTNYYPTGPGASVPVDPSIKTGKLLTGADFDVESITRLNDGTYWVGEEFGPYLLHFNASGQLLKNPVPHPVLRAPQNPAGGTNLPSSRGFESMTRNADGSKLYLTTESSINSETDKRKLEIYEFDTALGQYTGKSFKYNKDSSDPITGNANNASNIFVTGDMTHVGGDKYIVIERDDFQGVGPTFSNPARQKKLYLIDLSVVDSTGTLQKVLLADLLNIADPSDIGGPLSAPTPADVFNFPGQSIECVMLDGPNTLFVALDTNFPGGNSRTFGTPDNTEIIRLQFDVPIASIVVPEPSALSLAAVLGLSAMRRRAL